MDDDDSGSIGVAELQEPLIGLGFANNMEDVENMVAKVDEDGSNMIEFGEFLAIIKMSGGDEQTMQITKFFKDLNAGVYGTREISFNLFVLQQRRKYLMAAIMGAKSKFQDEDGNTHEYSIEM